MKKHLQNITLFIQIILLKTFCRFAKKGVENKSLLIIKVDAIGDFIIAHNFFEMIRNSEKYKGYNITVLGNPLWKDLATALNSDFIDEFIWTEPRGYKTYSERKNFYTTLATLKFSEAVIFHSSYSVFTEMIAFTVNANIKMKVGIDNAIPNLNSSKLVDKIYTKLFTIPKNCEHEFNKMQSIAYQLCENIACMNLAKPSITLFNKLPENKIFDIAQKYVLINCGAGDKKRQLGVEKMKIVVQQLLHNQELIYFTGTTNDIDYSKEIILSFPQNKAQLIDITGKTTLIELLHLVNHASLVVCNESSVYHMSVALKRKVYCFSGGGHFTRFANYPNVSKNLIFHQMECFNCNWNCKYTLTPESKFPCIEAIEISDFKKKYSDNLE